MRPINEDIFKSGEALEKNEQDRSEYVWGGIEATNWDSDQCPNITPLLEKAAPAFIRGFSLVLAMRVMAGVDDKIVDDVTATKPRDRQARELLA
jgi:hypothetical protein